MSLAEIISEKLARKLERKIKTTAKAIAFVMVDSDINERGVPVARADAGFHDYVAEAETKIRIKVGDNKRPSFSAIRRSVQAEMMA